MPTETVYKVVSSFRGRLFSWQPLPQGWVVNYYPELVIRPEFGESRLFAFSDLESAVKALADNRWPDEEIWEAEGETPEPILVAADACFGEEMFSFWQALKLGRRYFYPEIKTPKGTVGCRSVRLVRKIEPSEYPLVA